MTKLIIDLSDALDEFHPDDKVVVWSPVHREGARGQVVNTRPKRIRLTFQMWAGSTKAAERKARETWVKLSWISSPPENG